MAVRPIHFVPVPKDTTSFSTAKKIEIEIIYIANIDLKISTIGNLLYGMKFMK